MSKIPWNERVVAISINPELATMDDIAEMAAELMQANSKLLILKRILQGED